jgi:transcriptional regulator with XRE-family HTH domain
MMPRRRVVHNYLPGNFRRRDAVLESPAVEKTQAPFGRLLREWRARRGMSQLDLSVEAGVSSRHLSFVETGRAMPSREMVVLLARTLDVPLRDRNDLLTAAGYAAIYRATGLDAPALGQARRALDFMLRQQEPYPALVLDRHWNVLDVNAGSARVQAAFLDANEVSALGPPNAMRLMFHPSAFRPWIVNWEPTAASLIQWLHRDVATGFADAQTRALLGELLSYPDVPRQWRALDLDASPAPFLPIEFRKNDLTLRYFTTLTTLGTPHDITLQELRVESFFPADEATETASRRLAGAA